MRLIATLKQRIADWRRERRIDALFDDSLAHIQAGRRALAREAYDAAIAERKKRSDAQLTRLAIRELRRFPELARLQMKAGEEER